MTRTAKLLLFLLSLVTGPVQAGTAWTVEESSRLGFVATQGGATVEGVFEKFEAEIAFATGGLANSNVSVEIEIASVNSKSKNRDAAIISPGLFDVSKWPTASFEKTSFRRLEDGRFEADATLTMRDVTKPVTLPFKFEIKNDRAHVKGEMTVERLDYGIGQGPWKDTSVVGNTVKIFIDLSAKR